MIQVGRDDVRHGVSDSCRGQVLIILRHETLTGLYALEIVEGFQAIVALVQGLARG